MLSPPLQPSSRSIPTPPGPALSVTGPSCADDPTFGDLCSRGRGPNKACGGVPSHHHRPRLAIAAAAAAAGV